MCFICQIKKCYIPEDFASVKKLKKMFINLLGFIFMDYLCFVFMHYSKKKLNLHKTTTVTQNELLSFRRNIQEMSQRLMCLSWLDEEYAECARTSPTG